LRTPEHLQPYHDHVTDLTRQDCLIEESIAERLSVGLRGEVSPDDARRVRDEFRSLF
jgi:hypothetical protein